MRPIHLVGLDEDDLGIDFKAGAHGFGKRVARLDGHVDAAFIVGGIGEYNHRHFGQPRERLQVGVFERTGQFHRDNARTLAKNQAAQLGRELDAPGHHGEIREVTARETRGVVTRP